MNPVIMHADGTDCWHEGTPTAAADGSGPLCPAGILVTHVRFNGQILTMEQATEALMKIGRAFSEALQPLIQAFSDLGRKVNDDPGLRALADAYRERAR